jgi:predicted nucleic acid-binding protein
LISRAQKVQMSNDTTKILIDADVIIHFIKGNKLNLIPHIFPDRIVFVDKVLDELYFLKKYQIIISNFISQNGFERIELDSNDEYVFEYAQLIKFVGKGEAACMAIAKIDKNYIASSNLSDIREYCKKHCIKIITTMDFLWEAMKNQLLTDVECNEFIKKVKNSGSKLPVDTIEEYVKKYIMK